MKELNQKVSVVLSILVPLSILNLIWVFNVKTFYPLITALILCLCYMALGAYYRREVDRIDSEELVSDETIKNLKDRHE